jgi:hypothetical protein
LIRCPPRRRERAATYLAAIGVVAACVSAAAAPTPAWAAGESAPARVAAHSNDLLAVGLARDGQMSIHLSHSIDNSPVRDAVVTVVLRGTAHPTTAETDGSYTLKTPDLSLPGAAVVEFQVAEGALHETFKGTLDVAAAPGATEDRNSSRQLWWWVLNFAVCIGFLWMFSKRKKAADD